MPRKPRGPSKSPGVPFNTQNNLAARIKLGPHAGRPNLRPSGLSSTALWSFTDIERYDQYVRKYIDRDVARFARDNGYNPAEVVAELLEVRRRSAELQGAHAPLLSRVVDVRLWEKYATSNNCYGFGQNVFTTRREYKLQPGFVRGSLADHTDSCKAVRDDVDGDLIRGTYDPIKRLGKSACRPGDTELYTLIARGQDFHFVRGGSHFFLYWADHPGVGSLDDVARLCRVPKSFVIYANAMDRAAHLHVLRQDRIIVPLTRLKMHKRGHTMQVEFLDASGAPIYDVTSADFRYGDKMDYRLFCGMRCLESRWDEPTKVLTKQDANALDRYERSGKGVPPPGNGARANANNARANGPSGNNSGHNSGYNSGYNSARENAGRRPGIP